MGSEMGTCSATLKYAPSSVYKWKLVADLVRHMPVNSALEQLSVSRKACAMPMMKLIKSCVANSVNNCGLSKERLVVDEVRVGKAFTLRRFMPCGRGRSTRIEKRYSKITVVLKDMDIVGSKSKIDLKGGLSELKSVVSKAVAAGSKKKEKVGTKVASGSEKKSKTKTKVKE